MNELTEQLKLSKISDAEVGERIKAFVYIFVHVYCIAYVSGQTFKNIINTPFTELSKLCHELSHALNECLQASSSDAPKPIKQQSKLQLNVRESIVPNSLEAFSSENTSLLPAVVKMKVSRPKPIGFKNA